MITPQILKKAESIANKARKDIGKYCYEECRAYCCRKGYLILKPSQVDTVTQNRRKELEEKGILKKLIAGKNKGCYSMYMGTSTLPCPSLKDWKCVIHKSRKRARACRDFPIFFEDDFVKFSPRCPAVKAMKFYAVVKKLKDLGFKVLEADMYSELEMDKIEEQK